MHERRVLWMEKKPHFVNLHWKELEVGYRHVYDLWLCLAVSTIRCRFLRSLGSTGVSFFNHAYSLTCLFNCSINNWNKSTAAIYMTIIQYSVYLFIGSLYSRSYYTYNIWMTTFMGYNSRKLCLSRRWRSSIYRLTFL